MGVVALMAVAVVPMAVRIPGVVPALKRKDRKCKGQP